MVDDAQLLRRYAETKSETAFAELVQRHLGLVYHAALRQLGPDKHLAEDVAQAVFLLLAEKSPALREHTSLAGWLHSATHFKVGHALRAERRRRLRENAAFAMSELLQGASEEEWERIRPVLDQVLLELNASDREAVLLRFFENHPFAEIAARLALSESAAHKRVERALEKLRERLARRGVKSTAAALAVLLGAQAASAVPAGLASTVTAGVVASGLPVATAIGGVTFMSTKTTAVAASVAIALLTGIATFEVSAQREAEAALLAQERDNAALQARLRGAEERLAEENRISISAVAPASASSAMPASAVRPPTRGRASPEETEAFFKANPEVRELFVAYIRGNIHQDYADFIGDLNLTEEEANVLVLTRAMSRSLNTREHILNFSAVAAASPNIDDRTRTLLQAPRRDAEPRLREMLGETRYAQLQEYETTSVQRSVVSTLAEALSATPDALNPAQARDLKQLVIATAAETAGDFRSRIPSGWTALPPVAWAPILARAEKILTPAQIAALRDLRDRALYSRAQSDAIEKQIKERK